jgi:8-oxo-dGTP diphosphatase
VRALLVRHARAGKRGAWLGDDTLRPLDAKGRKQAERLAKTLAELGATRLVSSPYLRCVQTLEPAGRRLGLAIEHREELAEGSTADRVLGLLSELRDSVPALSTHGDVIGLLIGEDRPYEKGAAWVLDVEDGRVRPDTYLPLD